MKDDNSREFIGDLVIGMKIVRGASSFVSRIIII